MFRFHIPLDSFLPYSRSLLPYHKHNKTDLTCLLSPVKNGPTCRRKPDHPTGNP